MEGRRKEEEDGREEKRRMREGGERSWVYSKRKKRGGHRPHIPLKAVCSYVLLPATSS